MMTPESVILSRTKWRDEEAMPSEAAMSLGLLLPLHSSL